MKKSGTKAFNLSSFPRRRESLLPFIRIDKDIPAGVYPVRRYGAGMTLLLLLSSCMFSASAQARQVYTEDMTWMEVRDRIQGGAISVIIPVGGTEQNGPHMVTGKHNIIVRYTAGEIAKRLGNMMVAPVITYVPEGRINPPEGHMQFPGTMSVSEDTFTSLLEDAAASLRQHGFRNIYIIGDHGGTQNVQSHVAQRLTRRWESNDVLVMHVSDYYGNNGQARWAESIGAKSPNPGAHAALIDTSELMAIHAVGVRNNLRSKRTDRDYRRSGSTGDSRYASAKNGRRFLSLKIEAAMKQIQRGGYSIR